MLDVLEDYLEICEHAYCRIDGQVSQAERQRMIDTFNRNDDIFCFLLSTRAGGLGINLTKADTVIIYDSDWNPQVDLQAQDRCHRIGQTRLVAVYRLVTHSTVESRLLLRANQKLKLERLVMHKDTFTGRTSTAKKEPRTSAGLSEQEILDILNENEMAGLNNKKNSIVTHEELTRLLDREKCFQIYEELKKGEEDQLVDPKAQDLILTTHNGVENQRKSCGFDIVEEYTATF